MFFFFLIYSYYIFYIISVEGDMFFFFFPFWIMNSTGAIVIESCYEFSKLVEVFALLSSAGPLIIY